MRRGQIFAALAALAGAGLVVAISFGFLGHLHMAFDAFSHFRLHFSVLVAALGLGLLLTSRWRLGGLMLIVVACAAILATIGPLRLEQGLSVQAVDTLPEGPRYSLLQLNLRYDNRTPKAVLSLIGRVQPDVITLDEVSEGWKKWLALIGKAYPHQLVCPPPAFIGGVAILSRRPFVEGTQPRCYNRGALGIVQIDFGGRAVAVGAVHFGWPWPFDQAGQLPPVGRAVAGMGPDALLAGDFNAAPWSRTVEQTAAAGGLRILRGIGSTWLARPLPDALRRTVGLPIDNILVKGAVLPGPPRKLESVGSDHLPVLVEFGLAPKEERPETMQAMAGE